MNTKERINQLIETLGVTRAEFERICGLSNGYINSMRNNVGQKGLSLILKAYPHVNKAWLVLGVGEMFENGKDEREKKSNQEGNSKVVVMRPSGNIRYWEDVAATGGSPEFLMNPNEHDVRMIDVPNFGDCTDAVNIYGDSMSPLYKSGEVIILKEWLESWIDYGCVYLIVTLNGNRMVKYLRKADDDNKVKCVSENKEFDDFEIPKSDILRLFIVKGAIRKDSL